LCQLTGRATTAQYYQETILQNEIDTCHAAGTNVSALQAELRKQRLKAAMRRMPGTVTLVTTRDPNDGQPAGMAASAIIPVSMDPPSMLISIHHAASACGPINRSGRFCINLLGADQTNLVGPFSTSARRGERFSTDDWATQDGVPFLPGACSAIFCEVRTKLSFGTHMLFIGEVYDILGQESTSPPLGWIEGDFALMEPMGNIA
jgi:flavin reductase (DIM6/NTAB) family NADH-FMN oxidoreductase RutF